MEPIRNRYSKPSHGRSTYYIVGEGVVRGDQVAPAHGRADGAIDSNTEPVRAFRFTRMLPKSIETFDRNKLDELGRAMHSDPSQGPAADAEIPAGFTYFGQFVDHDITFDKTGDIPNEVVDPEALEQGRSPALDLDALYGSGPMLSPELYDPDRVKLRVGETVPLDAPPFPGANRAFPNDLPRAVDRTAIIGDPRNDENLAVAQTHLAFIKFHNKVVDRIQTANPSMPAAALFDAARKMVVEHYQWIILNDFLPRLCDRDVLRGMIKDAPAIVGASSMPVEFSAAAYRLGHSMIRPTYEWNKFFNSEAGQNGRPGVGIATLLNFFQFTGAGGFSPRSVPNQPLPDGALPALPSNWIVNWNFLFDFSEAGQCRDPQLNFARAIDASIADPLQNIPGVTDPVPGTTKRVSASLASRNLRRGAALMLPTGQEVARYFRISALTQEEIASGPNAKLNEIVVKHGFDVRTPLWFYVLKEAEMRRGGQQLGILGSLIVAGTFVSLIKGSKHSILREIDWRPELPSYHSGDFRMTDLLTFVDDLNPLGD